MRASGYLAYFDAGHNLLCMWRCGLNLARIVALVGVEAYRATHYALQLRRARVLLRNAHYPVGSPQQWHRMQVALHASCGSMWFIEIGDFNGPSHCP